MNPAETLLAGIAPEHTAALAAGILACCFLPWLAPAPLSPLPRWAYVLLGAAAAVHLALPLGHRDGAWLTAGFLLSGVAYGLLAWLARGDRRGWRLGTALLVPLNLLAYLVVIGRGGEEADQVGIAAALVELVAFGLAVVPQRQPGRPRRFARALGSTSTVLAVLVTGMGVWISTLVAHQAAGTAAGASQAPAVGHSHAHGHEHLLRAQAGVIMRPLLGDHHPTAAQADAAAHLAADTKESVRRFARLSDALAAGYELPVTGKTGPDVHLENPVFKADGAVLDPRRPEMLVFAIEGGRATLLGVVYVIERAGTAGPEPGGPVTRWHAHNLCISLAPPGIGVVTPFGGCPTLSVALTTPEMMHVWVVDPPGGAFAEGVDQKWARDYHRTHGLPTA
ncbi:hypothetical protein Cs7R123_34100 [Catellatospora sp. TT07R-123]|uniref:hypothetical protein n=1 Tax=Catellatospora sp. TT07R-123 TaxID=2733863 RepID=UPI001B2DFC77|nr:hypothetical protein [Catellatospora sp. TT07R-123]GHJ46068.1 hypothetical protein Cs7R123_34100 [Catellatospora sp. TT07R-123]